MGGGWPPSIQPPRFLLKLRPRDMQHSTTKVIWYLQSLAPCEVFFINFTFKWLIPGETWIFVSAHYCSEANHDDMQLVFEINVIMPIFFPAKHARTLHHDLQEFTRCNTKTHISTHADTTWKVTMKVTDPSRNKGLSQWIIYRLICTRTPYGCNCRSGGFLTRQIRSDIVPAKFSTKSNIYFEFYKLISFNRAI